MPQVNELLKLVAKYDVKHGKNKKFRAFHNVVRDYKHL